MTNPSEKQKGLTTQAKVMIAIIVMMAAGIVLRWDFVCSEVRAVIHNMFPR